MITEGCVQVDYSVGHVRDLFQLVCDDLSVTSEKNSCGKIRITRGQAGAFRVGLLRLFLGLVLGSPIAVCESVYKEEQECRRGDSYACLKQGMRFKDSRATKYYRRVIEISIKQKPGKDGRRPSDAVAITAGALLMGNTKRANQGLDVVCRAYGLPEACMIIAFRDSAQTPEKLEARISPVGKACSKGNAHACKLLAYIEISVRENKEIGFAALLRGCDLGDYDSCLLIGDDLLAKDKQNEAIRYYEKACEADFPGACGKIAFAYKSQGEFEKSKKFLLDKCQAGSGNACGLFADLYVKENDRSQLVKFYTKGCNNDSDGSCVKLGAIFVHQKRFSEARNILKIICEKESESSSAACRELGILCDALTDSVCAKTAFVKGCEAGNGKACMGVALVELATIKPRASLSKKDFVGVKKFLSKAREFMSTECSEGDNDSCQTMPQVTAILQKMGFE